jgi:hypothetical protein
MRGEVKTWPRISFAPAKPLPDSLGSFFWTIVQIFGRSEHRDWAVSFED